MNRVCGDDDRKELAFKLREHDGSPVACACCDYPAPTDVYDMPYHRREEEQNQLLLCQACANTEAATSHMYPNQWTQEAKATMRQAAWNTNALLDAMGQFEGFEVVEWDPKSEENARVEAGVAE